MDDQVRRSAGGGRSAVAADVARRAAGDHFKGFADLFVRTQAAAETCDVAGVDRVHAIEPEPDVEHVVGAGGDVDAGVQQLVEARAAAIARRARVAAQHLQVGDGQHRDLHAGALHFFDHASRLGVVVDCQRVAVAGDDPPLQAARDGLVGYHLQRLEFRHVLVVRVHVDDDSGALGDVEDGAHVGVLILDAALELGQAADRLRPHSDGLLEKRRCFGIGDDPFLGEGDQLDVDRLPEAFLRPRDAFERDQACREIDVDLGAQAPDPVRHRQ